MDLEKLVEKIKIASVAYYETSDPIMSDEEFDNLIETLRSIDPKNPILSSTGWGYDSESHLKKYPHEFKVTGINNKIKNYNFVESMLPKIKDHLHFPYVISHKLDGISAVAYYENRKLVRVLTRNNGDTGLDITKLLESAGIPKELSPFILEQNLWVRGEIVCSWEDAKANGYSHPRNMAAGLCNQLEVTELHKFLNFVAYDTNAVDFTEIVDLGFEVVPYKLIHSFEEYLQVENIFNTSSESFNYKYPVDGSVIVDTNPNSEFSKKYGYYNGSAKLVIKYQTKQVDVEVEQVVWQPTPRGKVIPVIQIKPVELSGAKITYCSGFNAERISYSDIGAGSIITITRANEVIPHWVGTRKCTGAVLPTEIEFEGKIYPLGWDGMDLVFEVDKLKSSIEKLVDQKKVDGVGPTTISKFVKDFNLCGFYELGIFLQKDPDNINFGDSAISRKLKETFINMSEGWTMKEMLLASYTDGVGQKAAELLSKAYNNDSYLLINDFVNLDGISEEINKLMPSYLVAEGLKNNRLLLEAMILNIPHKEAVEINEDEVISVCVTGSLSTSRSKWFKNLEGKVKEVAINKAKYLITNNLDSTSSKIKKARELGIVILTEAELFDQLGIQ